MARLLRSIFAIATLAFILQPTTTQASEFEFNGAGIGGMIIWDGDFAVSTSNNGCLFSLLNCETNLLALSNNLRIVVNGPANTDLTITSLYMILGLAPGTALPACDENGADVRCGLFMDFDALADLYNNNDLTHQNTRQENQSIPGYTDPNTTVPDSLLVYLRMDLPGGPVGLEQVFDFDPDSGAFLQALLALNPGLQGYVGLDLGFTEDPNLRPFSARVVTTRVPPSAVPEPGTMLLLGSGLAVAARRLRRGVRAR